MAKAYLNAIWEFQNFNECFEWLVKLDKECDTLRVENARLLAERNSYEDAYTRTAQMVV